MKFTHIVPPVLALIIAAPRNPQFHSLITGSVLRDRLRLLMIASAIVSKDMLGWLGATGLSLAVNIVPAVLIMAIGLLVPCRTRKNLTGAIQTAGKSGNIYYPNLR
ncbi:MAG: hypothetical protein K9N23_16150 [Akkermansiaceae bacterium]|nr:hypothetical protein [Akkermansiaceae bacterium]MCF7733224.1 hypothetical protein [Akkermansiaceae bacterium]